jgi:L-arabinose isomerase
MTTFNKYELWLLTGSQQLYGQETLETVSKHTKEIAEHLSKDDTVPVNVERKPVLVSAGDIESVFQAADTTEECVGLIIWMHTFSPGQMWVNGLKSLDTPFIHLHTQYNESLPWREIDMEFMNTNQSAHAGREFGHVVTKIDLDRKVVVGHWRDDNVLKQIGRWARAACAWQDLQGAKIARFGDNMRKVAVTEGDKVEAKIRFGCTVNGYGLEELSARVNAVSEAAIDATVSEYEHQYDLVPALCEDGDERESLREAAAIELGIRDFLENGDFKGFTTTFENLAGLTQLPGLAVQRLMADGYGFGPEGDWKSAVLIRAIKVMGQGLDGGTSLMEHYTYHLRPGGRKVLGAHMLEICESIAAERPSIEIHPLDIGEKGDPVRAVFNAATGPAVNVSLVDMGDRFRLIANEVEAVEPNESLMELPVARAVWEPKPDFETAIEAWIEAGGAHHTGYSQAITIEHLTDFAEIAGIEFLSINENTKISDFKKEIKWNEVYYRD